MIKVLWCSHVKVKQLLFFDDQLFFCDFQPKNGLDNVSNVLTKPTYNCHVRVTGYDRVANDFLMLDEMSVP